METRGHMLNKTARLIPHTVSMSSCLFQATKRLELSAERYGVYERGQMWTRGEYFCGHLTFCSTLNMTHYMPERQVKLGTSNRFGHAKKSG